MKSRDLLLLGVLALGSCTVGPDFQRPDSAGTSKWKEARAVEGAPLPDTWWRLFNDRDLTKLVERALAANPELTAARARVATSRALVGTDRARLFPTLNFNGSAGISRLSEPSATRNMPAGFAIDLDSQRYRGTFDLAYDADLWGRNKRQLEASVAQAAASEEMFFWQRLGVASEVARQYFLVRGLDAQQSVLEETIKSRKGTLDIQQSKADAGLSDALPSSQARTELELARNDLAIVERQRGAAEHALAVLCGTRPADFSLAQRSASGALPRIHAGLPAEVLNRRPDVRAAELNLRSANARIGVAQAAFYPNFSLSAGAGLESLDVKDFLNWESRVLALGAGLAAPVLDGGLNKASYQAALSRRDESLANYRNALLVALREVEDALVDLKGLAGSRRALDQALVSAGETQRLTQERYDKGLSSYLEVVDAGRTVLRIQLVIAQLDAQQRITLAALAKALGGGWSVK
jgi:multidrug efflux system outer membrane protein